MIVIVIIRRPQIMKITAVIPTKNEEKGIETVLKKIPPDIVSDVVVVDGSEDKTAAIARKNNATVVKALGKGKGLDIQIFLREYDLDSADIYVMLDGDNTYDPREIEKMVKPIIENEADIVMGKRFNGAEARIEDGAMTPINRFGNLCLTVAGRILYNRKVRDLCTGYWAFNKKAIKKINIKAKRYDLEANLFTQATKNGFRLKEIPIHYTKRIGESGLTVKDGFDILYMLLREKV